MGDPAERASTIARAKPMHDAIGEQIARGGVDELDADTRAAVHRINDALRTLAAQRGLHVANYALAHPDDLPHVDDQTLLIQATMLPRCADILGTATLADMSKLQVAGAPFVRDINIMSSVVVAESLDDFKRVGLTLAISMYLHRPVGAAADMDHAAERSRKRRRQE